MRSNSKVGVPIVLGVIALCLTCVCMALVLLYFFGDALVGETGISLPAGPLVPEFSLPQDLSNLPEWTILVYADADDDVLEQDIWFDVNEMELVGSTPQMNIVVQLDRAEGSFDGDGNWTETRRLYVTNDSDLTTITSPIVENIGEVDMGNPQTLVDFLSWGIQKYPAKKYAVILSDHGAGWTIGWTDQASNSGMKMSQITEAIRQVQSNMGDRKFEVIGFDACLMAMVEVYGQIYP